MHVSMFGWRGGGVGEQVKMQYLTFSAIFGQFSTLETGKNFKFDQIPTAGDNKIV